MGQNDQSSKKATEQQKSPAPVEPANEEAAPEFAVGIRVNDGETGDHVVATDNNPGEQKTDAEIARKMQDLFQDKINEGEQVEGEAQEAVEEAAANAEDMPEEEVQEAQSQVEQASSKSPGKKKKSLFGKKKNKDAPDASASEIPPNQSEAQSEIEPASSKSPSKEKKSRFGFKKKEKKEAAPEEAAPEQAAPEEAPADEPPVEEAPQEEPKQSESPKKEKKSRFGRSKKAVQEEPAKEEQVAEQAPVEEPPKEEATVEQAQKEEPKQSESPKKEKKSRFGRSKKQAKEDPVVEQAPVEEPPKEEAPVEEIPNEEPKQSESPKKEKKSRFGRSKKQAKEEPVKEEIPKEEAPVEDAPKEEEKPAESPKKEKKSRFGRSKKQAKEEPAPAKGEQVAQQTPVEEPPKDEAPVDEAPKEEDKPAESPKKEKKSRFAKKQKEEPVAQEPPVEEEPQQQEMVAQIEEVVAQVEQEIQEVPAPLFVKATPKKADTGNITLSPYDPRQIKTVVMPNKMKIVLISDPLAEKSAASLDVGIGNLHAPMEFNGLATFLQHMILNGSKKYPDQKKTDQFMDKFGGNLNAYTGLDNTNYTLEINHNGFDEGLDRFANYFISPLFNEDSKEKTLKIMHHQFKSALLNDEWKHLNLWMQLSNPQSITCRSVFPNKDQYSQPEAMAAVKDFFDQTYSANLMAVCITSNKPLSELEKIAKKFKDIKNKKIAPPNMAGPPPFGPDDGKKVVKMTTSSDDLEMRFVWCLPFYSDKINSYNLKVFLQLFGYQGPKSIISHLKRDGLATSIQARKKALAGITKFEVVVGLTRKGYDNYEFVAEAISQYAMNIQQAGPQENFANEMNSVGQLKFDFPDRSTPLANCVKYAGKARKVAESDLSNLVKSSYVRDVDGKLLQDLAEKFCDMNRVMIFLHSNEPQSVAERWTNTLFTVVDTSADFWKNLEEPTLGNVAVNVPEANALVPQSAEMKELSGSYSINPVQLDVPNAWYLQDHKFQHPKAIIQLQLDTRDAGFGSNPNSHFFATVWRKVLMEYAAEIINIGANSGSTFYVEVNPADVTFYWKGYSATLCDFVMQTLNSIMNMNKATTAPLLETSFANAKAWMVKDLEGAECAKPYKKALDLLQGLLVQGATSDKEMAALISGYEFKKFVDQKKKWMKSGQSTWLVHGNISHEDATALCTNANNLLNLLPVSLAQAKEQCGVVELQKGTNTVYAFEHGNSSFDANLSYYQYGPTGGDLKAEVLNTLVHTYLSSPFVSVLKNGQGMTKVAMREAHFRGVSGMWFLTMSDKHSSEDQTAAINEHLIGARGQIKKISAKDFEALKSALKDALTANPKDFAQENDRVWKEISSHQYMFDRQAQLVQALDGVKREELSGHFDALFFTSAASRLDIQMITSPQKEAYEAAWNSNGKSAMAKTLKRSQFTGSIGDFKGGASYYPDGVAAAYTAFSA